VIRIAVAAAEDTTVAAAAHPRKAKRMPEELSAKLSIVSLRLSRKSISSTEANLLLAVATTGVPGQVRARYLRDQGLSTVRADVHVDATGTASLELHAIVHVELTYKGDMVRSSPRIRAKINNRLQDLAQRHCAEAVHREVLRESNLGKT
jgi:hypothetical protein